MCRSDHEYIDEHAKSWLNDRIDMLIILVLDLDPTLGTEILTLFILGLRNNNKSWSNNCIDILIAVKDF
jgi:hypothetical protein